VPTIAPKAASESCGGRALARDGLPQRRVREVGVVIRERAGDVDDLVRLGEVERGPGQRFGAFMRFVPERIDRGGHPAIITRRPPPAGVLIRRRATGSQHRADAPGGTPELLQAGRSPRPGSGETAQPLDADGSSSSSDDRVAASVDRGNRIDLRNPRSPPAGTATVTSSRLRQRSG
jgi:hypothetical protein